MWGGRAGEGSFLFLVLLTDRGSSVAGVNPAVVAVFARALTTFSQLPPPTGERALHNAFKPPLPEVSRSTEYRYSSSILPGEGEWAFDRQHGGRNGKEGELGEWAFNSVEVEVELATEVRAFSFRD